MLSDQYSERKHTCVDTTMALDLIPVLHQDFLQYLSEITDIFFVLFLKHWVIITYERQTLKKKGSG